ncbi:MAG: AAA family ATPase [Metallosphaera sp.]|uniref:nucleotide-binding protein n=1 Tax=Metallosphaera sp. TaxID=2020860 RepID=UPI00317AB01F
MRFSIRSSKGGVGKSTIAISLSKFLAEQGNDVLLVDRDVIGYSSYLAGITSPGLVKAVFEGQDAHSIKEIKVGKGSITVLKYFGDGPEYVPNLAKIHANRELISYYSKVYRELITSKPFSFFVIDNPPLIRDSDEIYLFEHNEFNYVYPRVKHSYIFVSDGIDENIKSNLEYMSRLNVKVDQRLAFIINMVRPDELQKYQNIVTNIINNLNVRIGGVIPFVENIFQFSGELKDFPLPKQMRELYVKLVGITLEI